MKLVAAIALSLLAGCTLFHSDNSDRQRPDGGKGDTDCDITTGGEILLVNPYSLACESYYTEQYCDPASCDQCPAFSDGGVSVIPNWGSCLSPCIGQPQFMCTSLPDCRVTLEADHYFGSTVGDPYLGCYPTNQNTILDPPECSQMTAETCSSFSRCVAVYYAPNGVQCPIDRHREACPGGSFVGCIDVGVGSPGTCLTPDTTITCAASPPNCVNGATPGVLDGCYTGVCIPAQYCGGIHPF